MTGGGTGSSSGSSRRLFVVWGAAYATPNVGDMAIAQAIVRLLRRGNPEAQIAFVTSGRYQAHVAALDGVSIVDLRKHPLQVLRLLRRAGLLLVAGGVPFGDSTAALLRFLVFAAGARVAGAEVEVVASSAADARLRPVNELLCKVILSLIGSVAVRDQNSLDLLRRLRGDEAVDFVPDLALALDLESEAQGTPQRALGLAEGEPYVVVAARNFLADQPYLRTHFAAGFGSTEAAALLTSLTHVAEVLGRERRVVFLPMNVDEGDQEVGRRVAGRLGASQPAPILIEERLSVEHVCGLIKGADLVLGMRLHAVIFGIALDRPTVAQAYAGKVTGFMHWLGLEEDVVPLTSPGERLLEACERRLAQPPSSHAQPKLRQAREDIEHRFIRLRQRGKPARSAMRDRFEAGLRSLNLPRS